MSGSINLPNHDFDSLYGEGSDFKKELSTLKEEMLGSKKEETAKKVKQKLEAEDYKNYWVSPEDVFEKSKNILASTERKVGELLEKYNLLSGKDKKYYLDSKVDDEKTEFGKYRAKLENYTKNYKEISSRRTLRTEFSQKIAEYFNGNDGLNKIIQDKIDAKKKSLVEEQKKIKESVKNDKLIKWNDDQSSDELFGTFGPESNSSRVKIHDIVKTQVKNEWVGFSKENEVYIDYSEVTNNNILKKMQEAVGNKNKTTFKIIPGYDQRGDLTYILDGSQKREQNNYPVGVRPFVYEGAKIFSKKGISETANDITQAMKNAENKKIQELGYAKILKGFPKDIDLGYKVGSKEHKIAMIGLNNLIKERMSDIFVKCRSEGFLPDENTFSSGKLFPGVLLYLNMTDNKGNNENIDFITEDMLKAKLGDEIGSTVYDQIDGNWFGSQVDAFKDYITQRWSVYYQERRNETVSYGNEVEESIGGKENFVEGLDIDFGSKANAQFVEAQLNWEIKNILDKIATGKIRGPESANPFSSNGLDSPHLIEFETYDDLLDANVLKYNKDGLIPGKDIERKGVDLKAVKEIIDHGFDDKNTDLVRDYLNQKWQEAYTNFIKHSAVSKNSKNGEMLDLGVYGTPYRKVEKPNFENLKTITDIHKGLEPLFAITRKVAADFSLNEKEKNQLRVVEGWIREGMGKAAGIILKHDKLLTSDVAVLLSPNKDLTFQNKMTIILQNIDKIQNSDLKDEILAYASLNKEYLGVFSSFENDKGMTQDADELENLLQSGEHQRVENMIEAIPVQIANIEATALTSEDKAKALYTYYLSAQKSVENNGSQSDAYKQNASQIMRAIGQQVSKRIQQYILDEQGGKNVSMDENLVKTLYQITNIMRDNRNTENDLDTHNAFKDIEQAKDNLEFLMMQRGGVADKMSNLKPVDEYTEDVKTRTNISQDLTDKLGLGQNFDLSGIFSGFADFKVGDNENIFTADYEKLTIQQRILVKGLSDFNKRFDKQSLEDLLKKNPSSETLYFAIGEVLEYSNLEFQKAFRDKCASSSGFEKTDDQLDSIWKDIYGSYSSLHGVGGLVLSDSNMESFKQYGAMVAMISASIAMTIVTMGALSGVGVAGILSSITTLSSLAASTTLTGAAASGLLMGVYMKVMGMAMGHGYENIGDGVEDVASEAILMAGVNIATLGLGNSFSGVGKIMAKMGKLGKAVSVSGQMVGTTALFTVGANLKQKCLTDDYMTEEEFNHAMIEGMILAVLMPSMHSKVEKLSGALITKTFNKFGLTRAGKAEVLNQIPKMREKFSENKGPLYKRLNKDLEILQKQLEGEGFKLIESTEKSKMEDAPLQLEQGKEQGREQGKEQSNTPKQLKQGQEKAKRTIDKEEYTQTIKELEQQINKLNKQLGKEKTRKGIDKKISKIKGKIDSLREVLIKNATSVDAKAQELSKQRISKDNADKAKLFDQSSSFSKYKDLQERYKKALKEENWDKMHQLDTELAERLLLDDKKGTGSAMMFDNQARAKASFKALDAISKYKGKLSLEKTIVNGKEVWVILREGSNISFLRDGLRGREALAEYHNGITELGKKIREIRGEKMKKNTLESVNDKAEAIFGDGDRSEYYENYAKKSHPGIYNRYQEALSKNDQTTLHKLDTELAERLILDNHNTGAIHYTDKGNWKSIGERAQKSFEELSKLDQYRDKIFLKKTVDGYVIHFIGEELATAIARVKNFETHMDRLGKELQGENLEKLSKWKNQKERLEIESTQGETRKVNTPEQVRKSDAQIKQLLESNTDKGEYKNGKREGQWEEISEYNDGYKLTEKGEYKNGKDMELFD